MPASPPIDLARHAHFGGLFFLGAARERTAPSPSQRVQRTRRATRAVAQGVGMSRYRPYPAYKDSGIPWIGKVPEHWKVARLRYVAPFFNSNVDKKDYDGQQAVQLCNYTDVYNNEFVTSSLSFMEATASSEEISRFALHRGDVLMTKDSEDPADIGIPAYVTEDMPGVICGYHLTVIRSATADTGRYLQRAIQSHPTKAYFLIKQHSFCKLVGFVG